MILHSAPYKKSNLSYWKISNQYINERPSVPSLPLKVNAHYVRKKYKRGERVSDKQMKGLKIEKHETLSDWNEKLAPLKM